MTDYGLISRKRPPCLDILGGRSTGGPIVYLLLSLSETES